MNCVHCGRKLFRDPTATVTTRGGTMHWGPRCAAKAGLTKPPKRRILSGPTRMARAKHSTSQTDWIDNLETPQPDPIGLQPRAAT